MCGVFFCNFALTKKQEMEVQSWLLSRGPDGFGSYRKGTVNLFHSRLAFVDVDNGHQPFESENSVLICNGEIYNFLTLKENYELKPKTRSDCEIIQHGYEKFGTDFFEKLEGMYAGIIYIKNKNQITFFRDHSGEKPIFYFKKGNIIAAASEWYILAKIFSLNNFRKEAVQEYLFKQFISDEHIFDEIKKVPKGSQITFNLENHSIIGDIPKKEKTKKHVISEEKYLKKYKETVIESVAATLNHGEFTPTIALSSGLDSNLIVAIAKLLNLDFNVCTIGFENYSSYDESNIAVKLCERFYKLPIEKYYFPKDYGTKNILTAFRNRADLIGDGSVFILDELFKNINKNNHKVCITGLGGDEYFFDYPWIQRFLGNNTYRDYSRIRGFVKHLMQNSETIYQDLWQNRPYYKLLVDAKLFDEDRYEFSLDDKFSQVELGMKSYLTEVGLAQSDRLSLRYKIEARSPLVSKQLDNLYGLTFDKLLKIPNPKSYVYKKCFSDILPARIFKFKKQGFRAPVEKLDIEMNKIYLELNSKTVRNKISYNKFSKLKVPIKRVYLNLLIITELFC